MKKAILLIAVLAVMLFPGVSRAQAGPQFFYAVTAVDTNGFESALSTQASVTFTQGQSKATLTWVAPVVPAGGAAIAGYKVYRGKVSGGPYALISTSLVTAATYVDQFVLPNAPSGLAATGS